MNFKMKKYLLTCVCWILATIGLIWQIYQVSKIFFTFSTRVDIEMDFPLYLTMPAITICLPLSPSPITLRTLFNATKMRTDQMQKEVIYLPIKTLATLETIDAKVFCLTKYPRVMADAPDGQPCDLFGKTLQWIEFSRNLKVINRCTTYLHQGEHTPPLKVIANEAKDFYILDIYSPKASNIYIYVHNPAEILSLPESDFFVVFTNQSSDIVVTSSRLTINLPRDTFVSTCLDYKGFRFGRMSCIFRCRARLAEKMCGIWSSEVPAQLDTELAFQSRSNDCPEIRQNNCSSYAICPVQCSSVRYSTSLVWNHMKDRPSNYTRFYVRRPYGLEFVYNVSPSLAPVEYSCYVASCLGIWFGISFSGLVLQMLGKSNGKKIESPSGQPLTTIKPNRWKKVNHNRYHGFTERSLDPSSLNCYTSKSNQFYQRKAFPPTYLS